MKKLLVICGIIFLGVLVAQPDNVPDVPQPIPFPSPIIPPLPVPPPEPIPDAPHITTPIPNHLPYNGIVAQLNQWKNEARDFVQVDTYGKTAKNIDLTFIKITNKYKKNQKTALITACIHGNEPLASGVIMAYIGTLLNEYSTREEVRMLLDSREICFVPVVSPDSYPHSRIVDGVDPNRNFPLHGNHKVSPTIQALANLAIKNKFNAAISGHTYGRVLLTPYGYTKTPCPHEADFLRIIGTMGGLCKYEVKRACNMYSYVIDNSDVDFYYSLGAFAIVMEFGTHQNVPTPADIKSEFDRTYPAFLYFLREAPTIIENR